MNVEYEAFLLLLILLPLNIAFALPKKGTEAPNFLAPTYGGGSISLYKLKGKIVVLMFAAEWCPHCRREIPTLSSAWKEMGLEVKDVIGIVMIVSSQEDKAIRFFKATNPPSNWELVTDANYIAEKYGVSGVPTVIVLDKNSAVADVKVGEVPPGTILRTVALLAGISPPEVNNTQTQTQTKSTVTYASTPSQSTTTKERSESKGMSMGVMMLIALAVIVLLIFGLWYFKTLKAHETKKLKKKKKYKKSK